MGWSELLDWVNDDHEERSAEVQVFRTDDSAYEDPEYAYVVKARQSFVWLVDDEDIDSGVRRVELTGIGEADTQDEAAAKALANMAGFPNWFRT